MTVTFFSNFLNHHQLPFCLEMQKHLGNNFKFVATEKIPEERLNFGYDDINNLYDFVVKSYENEDEAYKLGLESDVVIIGSAPQKYIKKRLKLKKITFRYSERIFRTGFNFHTWLSLIKNYTFLERKNVYLLCSSAYTARDFNIAGAYINKCLKWGYFPQNYKYKKSEILNNKNNKKINILWVARFLELKHPEKVIFLAEKLKNEKIDFSIKMIGDGPLYDNIKKEIHEKGLNSYIHLLGAINNKLVRKHMNEANIFLFTSDYREGWGAVLNEAMNSACAVVVNNTIGSVPFLINDDNGIIYQNNNDEDLYKKVKKIISDKNEQIRLGLNAYKTITEYWNAEYATKALLKICSKLLKNDRLILDLGMFPCSKALFLKDVKRS